MKKKCPNCFRDEVKLLDVLVHSFPMIRKKIVCGGCGSALSVVPRAYISFLATVFFQWPAFIFLIFFFVSVVSGWPQFYYLVIAIFLTLVNGFILSCSLVDIERLSD